MRNTRENRERVRETGIRTARLIDLKDPATVKVVPVRYEGRTKIVVHVVNPYSYERTNHFVDAEEFLAGEAVIRNFTAKDRLPSRVAIEKGA